MTNTNIKTLEQQIAELTAANLALQAKVDSRNKITLKIGEKGGVSMTGINVKFPVTLYANQWQRVLAEKDRVLAFIDANKDKLSWKA